MKQTLLFQGGAAAACAASSPPLPADAIAFAAGLRRLRPDVPVDIQPLMQSGRSWVALARRFAPSTSSQFRSVWQARPEEQPRGMIMGRMVTFPRWNQAYGFDYVFTGQVAKAKPVDEVNAFCELLREMQTIDPRLNSILANWYEASAGHYMGPHSDDERQLVPGCPIVSVSLCSAGHSRRFRLAPKPAHAAAAYSPCGSAWRDEAAEGVVIRLRDGDLLVMGGDTQLTHKHEVLRPTGRAPGEKEGRRVNLTFRGFSESVGQGAGGGVRQEAGNGAGREAAGGAEWEAGNGVAREGGGAAGQERGGGAGLRSDEVGRKRARDETAS
jgi:alkylated DNA repair dioxygenase AlkB